MTTTLADIVSLDRERRKRAGGAWNLPEPVIVQWRCRTKNCIALVGVTQTAIDTLAYFNGILRQRRERAIAEAEVMLCLECAKRGSL